MATKPDDQVLTPEDRRFREYIMLGDDFRKIEIFRYAANWYRKAFELRPDDPEAKKKLEECRTRLRNENRTIAVIIAVAAVMVLLIAFIR
jgi:hypothetical protein